MSRLEYDPTLLKAVGERLKQLRIDSGYSLKEFAKIACIDRDSYSRVEKGERNASIGLLCNIASGLDIKPSKIFDDNYMNILEKHEEREWLKSVVEGDEYYRLNKQKVISILKCYRKKKNISQSILARELNVPRDMLNNLEYGRGRVKSELLIGLLDLLDISAEDLLNRIGFDI